MGNKLKIALCLGVFLLMLLPALAISLPYLGNNDTEEKAIMLKDPDDPHFGKKAPADLKITDIFTSPSSPVGGESATIYAKIENIGDKDVKIPFYSTLYIDGSYSATKYLAELVAGGYAYLTKTVTLASGYHELKAIADAYEYVKEPDEANNQRIENILWENPAPLPDIAAVDIWTSPASPIGGQFATIYFKISTNSVAFSQTVDTELYYDGDWKVTKHLYGSTGSATYIYSHSIILAAGIHEIKMITDSANAVVESSESNNQRIENILWQTPTPYPDLIVTSIVVYNEVTNGILNSVYSGWPVRISATVKNNGDAAAGASVVELRDILGGSPTVMGTANVPALSVGATYTASFTGKYISSTGTHTLRGIADSTYVVDESVETNNEYDKTGFVVSLSSWTVGIYIDADEYLDESATPPTTLEPAAIGDIEEMKLAGSLYGSLNIIVMLDMYDGEGSYPFSGARIYLVQVGSVYQIADLGEVNMADPITLRNFVTTYSLGRFEASQSMLVLWDHGGGCIGGLFEDEHIPVGTDNVMSLPDLEVALSVSTHIDILAFHACLMSSTELGYELGGSQCDIIVGFEDIQHFDGFPYGCSASYTDGIFNYMRQNPTASDVTVAYEMVDRTFRSYQSGGSQDAPDDFDEYLAVAAFDADLVNLGFEINDVGHILSYDDAWYEAYWARYHCQDFASQVTGGWSPTDWAGFYVDVYDFMRELRYEASSSGNMDLYFATQQVIDELYSVTIHAKFGSEHDGLCGGIHLYFPSQEYDRDYYQSTYDTLDMSNTLWDEFINEYPYSPY